MKEDFVSFGLAKKLKEKGFPQYTEKSYFVGDHKKRMCSVGTFLHVHTQNTEHLIAAPTIAQALKWLREEKGVHIEIRLFCVGYGFDIIRITDRKKLAWSGTDERDKYEQAVLAGIEYVIDNLIQL